MAATGNANAAAGAFLGGIVILIIGHVVKSSGKHATHKVEVVNK